MRSIPTDLLNKINAVQQTIYNNAQPKMSVQVSRAKTTVSDSTYWTIETIRERTGLGDLSIAARRQNAYGPPNRIYNIYIENNVVRTAIREYPDYLKEKWKDQFDLGTGTAVAIAFDGEWEWYRKEWQLKSYEKPFIFWVDGAGKLWSQLWDDVSTLFELSTGVSKVKAIRGWKNANFADQDHGVVAGYIKADGKVYYRGWCRQVNGTTIWETEKQLTEFTGTAVNLNLFITNDYRMGFVIEDSLGKIMLFITTRNWAGMAIQPHTITAAAGEVKIDFIAIEYIKGSAEETITGAPTEILLDLRYVQTDNKFIDIYNQSVLIDEIEDWGKELIFRTQNKLYNINSGDFEIIDSFNRSYYPNTAEEISDRVYKLSFTEFNNFNNVDDIGTLKFRGLVTTNGVNVAYLPFEKVFYPINLIPTSIPLPEVKEVWNE